MAYVQSTLALQQEKVIKKLTKSVDEYLDQSEAKMDAMINGDAFQASLHPSSSYGGTIQPLFQVSSSWKKYEISDMNNFFLSQIRILNLEKNTSWEYAHKFLLNNITE